MSYLHRGNGYGPTGEINGEIGRQVNDGDKPTPPLCCGSLTVCGRTSCPDVKPETDRVTAVALVEVTRRLDVIEEQLARVLAILGTAEGALSKVADNILPVIEQMENMPLFKMLTKKKPAIPGQIVKGKP